MNAPVDPTGQQIRIQRGDVTAHVAQVGASLRGLTVRGTDVIADYPLGMSAPQGSGIVLVPWPNRVRDGRWSAEDPHGNRYDEQLAITEPSRDNAIHGLLRYAPYVVAEGDGEVTLTAAVVPQTGYPFSLDTRVTYALTDDGLAVTHEIANVGSASAPVAVGTHPFFRISGAESADLTLAVPAATRFRVDDRLLPLAEDPIAEDDDLRGGRRLGDLDLDDGYGQLERGADGLARTTLVAPDGRTVTMWQDEAFGCIQVFTSTTYPGHDLVVAVEPMTAPTDALNSGQGLKWLEPGETWTVRWGIELTGDGEAG